MKAKELLSEIEQQIAWATEYEMQYIEPSITLSKARVLVSKLRAAEELSLQAEALSWSLYLTGSVKAAEEIDRYIEAFELEGEI